MKKKSNKEKINPMIKNQKNVKSLKIKNENIDEEEGIIKKFVVITLIIIIIVGAIYGLTELLKDEEPRKENDIVSGDINYDKVSVGTILNRPYDEYYVMLYSEDDTDAVIYSTIMTKYMNKSTEKNYIKMYYCDLNNKLNSDYYDVLDDGISNSKATSIEEFDFGDITLLKIKDGKIVEYIENLEDIKNILNKD